MSFSSQSIKHRHGLRLWVPVVPGKSPSLLSFRAYALKEAAMSAPLRRHLLAELPTLFWVLLPGEICPF